MDQQDKRTVNAAHQNLSLKMRAVLIVSLVIISIFPIFVTFAPQEWPPQPSVLAIDTAYLLILVGYLLVLTGRNRSGWLVATITVVSIIGVIAMGWLALTLATLNV